MHWPDANETGTCIAEVEDNKLRNHVTLVIMFTAVVTKGYLPNDKCVSFLEDYITQNRIMFQKW